MKTMKPQIFFSHSSLDSEPIQAIKERIQDATGNTLDIFLSTDGASIPFGKNWLKQIEDALKLCKLMFVWVTPNSAQSRWLYFESGYAYSRGINVVPVGFLGARLESLPAPLNLLQGFNINSAQSLNNIIAVINREFELTFPEDIFDDSFYASKVLNISDRKDIEILSFIDHLECDLHQNISLGDDDSVVLNHNWMKEFVMEIKNKGEKFFLKGNELFGVGYKIYDNRNNNYARILIDPLALNNLIEILSIAYDKAYGDKIKKIALRVFGQPSYKLPLDNFLIGSRLLNTEVDFNTTAPNLLFKFRNIEFGIGISEDFKLKKSKIKKSELRILIDKYEKEKIPLFALIKLLVKQNIYTQNKVSIDQVG